MLWDAYFEKLSLLHDHRISPSPSHPGGLQTFSEPSSALLPHLLAPLFLAQLSSLPAIRQMPKLLNLQNLSSIERRAGVGDSNGS